jgi:hypothetical protein
MEVFRMTIRIILAAAITLAGSAAFAQDSEASFFVTSENPGNGGNFGGLEGADAHCTELAEAAGVTGKTWRAYLSTSEEDARDRIGEGPWVNAAGEEIADTIGALHSADNRIARSTALDETGAEINGRGDDPNRHDILTGSTSEGTVSEGQTCEDWTSSGEGAAMVGHHDRLGPEDLATGTSWNAAHPSRGCSLEALQGTGGDGLLYCFAAD